MTEKPTPTLININEFSPGEILSFIGIKMLKQSCMSVKNNSCRYRGDNGTKCAIGFLIPDEIYTPQLEEYTDATELIAGLKFTRLKDIMYDLLDDLQCLHDSGTEPWREGLLDIALEYSCQDEVLKAFTEAGV